LSFGVVTCDNSLASESGIELVKLADDLMYQAKQDGKNQIKSEVY